ncbi:hypothetical protein [Nubsella zeaxanthinifaciens]|uniref:hypothetical protein n=1 Tax=Nubsella zeaxanthinifaciens TaxID=392412 RepID=UPI000DE53B0D|nr:hypothetical protein [Nubsella zeaxanthinifaciens]
MKKSNLKLREIQMLDIELNGNAAYQINGLLTENIAIKTKYWLSKLAAIVAKESKEIANTINELVKQYGQPSEKNQDVYEVKVKNDDGEKNPNYEKFNQEIEELLNQEIEIEHAEFNLDMFDNVSSNLRLDVFFKLIG